MFPDHKTKIVATIGPASQQPAVIEGLLRAGMNIARINLSHGHLDEHRKVVARLREAAAHTGRRLAIMADLPGPKIRLGDLREEPVELVVGEPFTLTTEVIIGDKRRATVGFEPLPRAVSPGDTLFINDGLLNLVVNEVTATEVHCEVVVGGELRSRKGLNLPGVDLGVSAFTARDRECLRFAAQERIDAVSQSFVNLAEDLRELRALAAELDYHPFVIAKIERLDALGRMDEILGEADGIMVARGDLGVEIPIERIAVVQKELIRKARRLGKPVITATQMLESMVAVRRPTRAEATDVANAILDGTDCVMLSAESAIGRFPIAAVEMLAAIARSTEPARDDCRLRQELKQFNRDSGLSPLDLIALNIHYTLERSHAEHVIAPTRSGTSARNIARFRLPVWVVAFSPDQAVCQALEFSYGVHPECVPDDLVEWTGFARSWLQARGMAHGVAILAQGPREGDDSRGHRFELLDLGCCL